VFDLAEAFGGSFNSLLDILRHRSRDAFEVLAVLPGRGSCARELEALDVAVLEREIVPAARNVRYLRAAWSFRRRLRRLAVDLLYFADYTRWRPAELLGARLAGVPSVVHVRTPISRGFARDPSFRSATAIVGNSNATLAALRGLVAESKLHVVYNFVDLERFGPGPDARAEFFAGHPPVVGFVGTFRPEKRVEDFLAMAKLVAARRPEVRFLAAGGDSRRRGDGGLEAMRRQAAAVGIGGVVHFTGGRTDIPEIMRSLDVLVVPSLNEGFGRVIIEANAVGKPVVACNAAAIPEVVEEGETGFLVPVRNPPALAEAVLRVLDDHHWRSRVAMIAPARVRERFAPDRQVAALEAIWRRAIDG
jgi:glycosyltransferase involved in cell wall biosynthesis